jgi:hypothetical protein
MSVFANCTVEVLRRTLAMAWCGLAGAVLILGLGASTGVAQEPQPPRADAPAALKLSWEKNILSIAGPKIPGGDVMVWYLEAYCRPGSTDRDWQETVIGHKTELLAADPDGRSLKLRCTLHDGVVVEHSITTTSDEVDFRLTAHNPTKQVSQAHWAQPCVRVDRFTGRGQKDYLPKCFVFHDGKPVRLPFEPWATKARYVPGQVWCPRHVDRGDVNPRPLSEVVLSNGLIGCYSADEQWILATAWEPYQELFQGVIVCLHADFRLGGLKPGETRKVRGKLYIVPARMEELRKRYEKDFPEQVRSGAD